MSTPRTARRPFPSTTTTIGPARQTARKVMPRNLLLSARKAAGVFGVKSGVRPGAGTPATDLAGDRAQALRSRAA